MQQVALYWSRRDFRLADNPALTRCVEHCTKTQAIFLPIFVFEDYMREARPGEVFSYASRFFLAHALPQFAAQFKHFFVLTGTAAQAIIDINEKITAEGGTLEVFVNEDVYSDFYAQIKKLQRHGVTLHIYPDQMTVDRHTVSGSGTKYSVFTPFKNAVWEQCVNAAPLPAITTHALHALQTYDLEAHGFKARIIPHTTHALMGACAHERVFRVAGDGERKTITIDTVLDTVQHPEQAPVWFTSEHDALHAFTQFVTTHLPRYKDERDSLALDATSHMSLALTWGLVSARTLIAHVRSATHSSLTDPRATHHAGAMHFISELIWREFYKYLLYHNPRLMEREFQERFRGTIRWVEGSEAYTRFTAWMRGKTGYPIVDAAMLQLARAGYMHNRARMIVASVLTKNLGVDWRWGQEYFRAMLLDLDEASNNGGWQWGASVGADPKPIRIFNPYLQAENYDPDATYQKQWLAARYGEGRAPLIPHPDARADALRRYGLSSKSTTE